VAEYEVISHMPALMVDDWGTVGTSAQAARQWRQFWRLHPEVKSAAGGPQAAAADGGEQREE